MSLQGAPAMASNSIYVMELWADKNGVIKFSFVLTALHFVAGMSFSLYEFAILQTFIDNYNDKRYHQLPSLYNNKYGVKISPEEADGLMYYKDYEQVLLGLSICGIVVQVFSAMFLYCVSSIQKLKLVTNIFGLSFFITVFLLIGCVSFDVYLYGIEVVPGIVVLAELAFFILLAFCFYRLRLRLNLLQHFSAYELPTPESGCSTNAAVPAIFVLPSYEEALGFPRPNDSGDINRHHDAMPPNYEEISTPVETTEPPPQYTPEIKDETVVDDTICLF